MVAVGSISSTTYISRRTNRVLVELFQWQERKHQNQERKLKSSNKTDTWPPKIKKSRPVEKTLRRPKTANLEKPSVLNPNLVDKLDMSMLSKELLSNNKTRIRRSASPLCGKLTGVRRQSVPLGQESVGVTKNSNSNVSSLVREKRQSFEALTDSELSHVKISTPPVDSGNANKQESLYVGRKVTKRFLREEQHLDSNNNKNGAVLGKISSLSVARKKNVWKPTLIGSDVDIFAGPSKGILEPCKTCGRADLPERFHSHPKGTVTKIRDNLSHSRSRTAIPKTIQKPVPLNFRSERNKSIASRVQNQQSTSIGVSTASGDIVSVAEEQNSIQMSASKRRPRTVTCYICSREFGTASFPIHEPKCMEKWERENNALPSMQRRPKPQRPNVSPRDSEWNAAAWKHSQAQLVPCPKCGRTFLPDRLPVHERCCKALPKPSTNVKMDNIEIMEKAISSSTNNRSLMVLCQSCGHRFLSKDLKAHKLTCAKSSRSMGDTFSSTPDETMSVAAENILTPSQIPQKRTITCYLCGRDFGTRSIVIHEPQCLKKWHQENEKLPPNYRRNVPQKPDISIIGNSGKDIAASHRAAMAEANRQVHLSQLIPCKRCGRSFVADRISVHERCCRGTPAKRSS
ncbi:uncharacterized protein LOC107269633 isoform X2 [Cephus cinctus]|uniref:Uncharacterized protein LOC107269633 isoform X2 n=1 Tax=Cephus cinctus TaxID=211228 RepID=A0AAJ7RKN3_CEPCN|nr:uncharacterized protein LOC107269633 isoform X2 [Cephus cinctus]